MTNKLIKPPFPWFGGKRQVSNIVWRALGNVDNYVEPFFGSGAVMFNRPTEPRKEIINDKDHWVANFWRAVQKDPEAVARWADNPVNEDDLTARHIHLVKYVMPELSRRIMADPEYFDAKAAGWWVWGICCWIGSGWCSGAGPWTEKDGELVLMDRVRGDEIGVSKRRVHLGGRGVNRQLVHLGSEGQDVNRQLVHLGSEGQGVNRKLVHLGDEGRGVNRKRVHLGSEGQDVLSAYKTNLIDYMTQLSNRLARVSVCCGDWKRVVTDGALSHGAMVGVFLDPPYTAGAGRNDNLYNQEDLSVGHEVYRWAMENGDNPRYRIALCGYEGEYEIPDTWETHKWKAGACYQQSGADTANEDNRKKERVWFSPHCLPIIRHKQAYLFDVAP